jgi:hypothetical protein
MAEFDIYDLREPSKVKLSDADAIPRSKPVRPGQTPTSRRLGVSRNRRYGYWTAQLVKDGHHYHKTCLTEAEAIAWRIRFEIAVYGKHGGATSVRGRTVPKEFMRVRAICDDNIVRTANQVAPAHVEGGIIPAIIKAKDNQAVSGYLFIDEQRHVWRFRANTHAMHRDAVEGEDALATNEPAVDASSKPDEDDFTQDEASDYGRDDYKVAR